MAAANPGSMGSTEESVVVTGGAGFIGSALVRHLVGMQSTKVINVDKLTYAGSESSISELADAPNYQFCKLDIAHKQSLEQVFSEHNPSAVINLAAETHVDRSIDDPSQFIHTNILGTYTLLEVARKYWGQLNEVDQSHFRLLHVSTDEVFGSLGKSGQFDESTPYDPSSPYSASKAASDHLVRAWHRTYGLPVLVTNCSNNYGPYQFAEKLIPLMVLKAINNEPLPVYGNGSQIRDWLYVEDHIHALICVLKRGAPGQTYNIGGQNERTNIQVVQEICAQLELIMGKETGYRNFESLITFVQDRPGHDQRYAINSQKIVDELGWRPRESFETGLRKTVQWIVDHRDWYESSHNTYQGQRLGKTNPPATFSGNS